MKGKVNLIGSIEKLPIFRGLWEARGGTPPRGGREKVGSPQRRVKR